MILFLASGHFCYGQVGAIKLINPSFEDFPQAQVVPRGWYDCGFSGESAPDTHPSGAFEVQNPPSDGETYLGMVVRDNDTWERVTQRLTGTIQEGQCYSFSLDLCRSSLYVSYSKQTGTQANYVTPAKIRIWGSSSRCQREELLAESPLVKNYDWEQYNFKLEPKQSHTYIVLEAFYKEATLFSYNGNILIDNASVIEPIPCEEEVLAIAAKVPEIEIMIPSGKSARTSDRSFKVEADVKNIDSKTKLNLNVRINGKSTNDFSFNPNNGVASVDVSKLRKGENEVIISINSPDGTISDKATIFYEPEPVIAAVTAPTRPQNNTPKAYEQPTIIRKEEIKIEGYSRKELKAGQAIRIEELSFNINDSTINQSAYGPLDGIYKFLMQNRDVVVEIGGHTNGVCDAVFCNQLSTARAKAVAMYLKEKGIPMRQVKYKGYGKTEQLYSNKSSAGRKKNQRVEIKILSLNG